MIIKALFSLAVATAFTLPASAETADSSTTQKVYAAAQAALSEGASSATARVVITSKDGVKVLTLIDPTVSLGGFLASEGYDVQALRTEADKPVPGSRTLSMGDTLFLFQVHYSGSQQKIKIPVPVEKIKTTELLPGVKETVERGRPGLGIVTTIVEESLASDAHFNVQATKKVSSETESLTVIRAPEARVVKIGVEPYLSSAYPKATSECSNGSEVPSDVDPRIIAIHEDVCKLFPDITSYGTYRDYCTYTCDHRDGIAVDIMVSGDRGKMVAKYLTENYVSYGINNVIYQQKIWSANDPFWDKMEDRGDPTQNHFDHVHVSVFPSQNIVLEPNVIR